MSYKFIFSFILIISLFSAQKTIAQAGPKWAPIGAKWYFTKTPSYPTPGVTYCIAECVGDTVISGITCSIIKNDNLCEWEKFYSYESNDSVFFYNTYLHKFCLLYDFSASQGDTWTIPNIPFSSNNYTSADSIIVHVDSTGQVLVSGYTLKVLYLSSSNPSNSSSINPAQLGGKVIENIGGIWNFTPTYANVVCDPVPGGMRCYISDSLNFHTGLYSCTETTVGLTIHNKKILKIYPNPVKKIIQLQGKLEKEQWYEIRNTIGQIIQKGVIKSNQIPVVSLSKGLYYLNIIGQDKGTDRIIKFIKK